MYNNTTTTVFIRTQKLHSTDLNTRKKKGRKSSNFVTILMKRTRLLNFKKDMFRHRSCRNMSFLNLKVLFSSSSKKKLQRKRAQPLRNSKANPAKWLGQAERNLTRDQPLQMRKDPGKSL